jgi:histidinol-phosphate aminotransferase
VRLCADRGVRVWGLPGEGVRVSIGDRAANEAFAAAAARYAEGPGGAAVVEAGARR